MLSRFVIRQDLATIYRLDVGANLLEHLQSVEAQRGILQRYREESWLPIQDEAWLLRNPHTNNWSLEVDHIANKYRESDEGPMAAWYRTLLDRNIDDVVLNGSESTVACETCLTKWGFVFWDRQKLDWHSDNRLVSYEQMAILATGVSVDNIDLRRNTWGRERGLCDCERPWSERFERSSGYYY